MVGGLPGWETTMRQAYCKAINRRFLGGVIGSSLCLLMAQSGHFINGRGRLIIEALGIRYGRLAPLLRGPAPPLPSSSVCPLR